MSTYNTIEALQKVMKYYISLAITIPLSISLVAMVLGYTQHSYEKKACVHRQILHQLDIEFLLYTNLPMIITCSISIIYYVRVFTKLRKVLRTQDPKELLVLLLYPGIFIVCWTHSLCSANTIQSFGVLFDRNLIAILRGLAQLQGFMDALVYGEGSKGMIRRSCAAMKRCRARKQGEYCNKCWV